MTVQPLDQKTPLMAMPLQQEKDVVLCRNRARLIAGMLGFDKQQQVRIATAVSEIARNAFRYAKGAAAEFALISRQARLTDPAVQALLVIVKDQGPGMAALEAVLAGTYSSTTGMGMGIRGARRLMDSLDIQTGSQGTTVIMTHQLPRGARITSANIQKIVEELTHSAPANPMDELAVQNTELVQTIEELNTQRGELDKINEELSETNRGVVALYDELDTVYRVSRVVASKLDFESLLSAITDATVDISGAEFGVFFHRDGEEVALVCHAASGVLAPHLKGFSTAVVKTLTAEMAGVSEALRVDNSAIDRLGEPFGPENRIATTLSVAVRGSDGSLAGIMLFGHRTPNFFTERTERILASVAVQVSIGIENAKLYQSVRSASLAKDNFLAILSHELRTPLNPVFGILSALEGRKDLPADVPLDLQVMRRNLELEARLIDDLLDLTRIVKGNIPLQSKVIDLHELIHSVCRTCLSEIQRKELIVDLQLNARTFHVIGDPTRLQQVLWNLLNNAIKFTPVAGKVVFQTSDDGSGRIRISLTDTGRGIDFESMERIFRPFEQGDPHVATQFGGLGLGLAISKAILDAHGGDISASSEGMNAGATFTVILPLTETPVSSEQASVPSPAEVKGPAGLSILLVDDHEDTREIMSRLLVLRGHAVVTADCCAAALERAAGQEFDLLVSDLGLPDGSGHGLMKELKEKYSLKGIALSGYGMESDLKRSEEAGFIAHLTKPVDLASLEAVIQKIFS
jgi:signal transduction histidine kinase